MTMMTGASASVPARNNIYTVLALVSLLALVFGVGYVAYKNISMTSNPNPFNVEEPVR